jgi:transcriptional regulator with XRE-family HTH domain
MNIMERIDTLCKEHHISKYRLSQITGISQSAFSKMARQQSSLSLETIQRISDAFGISMAQFFSDADEYPDLTEQQKRLIHYWTLMNAKKREFVLLLLEKLVEI